MQPEHNQRVKAFFDETHLYLKNRFGIRLRQRIVNELLGIVSSANILDIGCGDGSVSLPLLQGSNNFLTLLDLSEHMLAEARLHIQKGQVERVSFYHGDFLTFEPTHVYDIVLCMGVLAHVPSVESTINKLARIMKPGGFCVIQLTDNAKWITQLDSTYSVLRSYLHRDKYRYHLNRLTFTRIKDQLTQAGFNIEAYRRYSLLLPGMGKLPDSFLYFYQLMTLQNRLLSARGSEVILLVRKVA
jgi:ubiquinone/menaquinone biosynthesis C-methylase UbiE